MEHRCLISDPQAGSELFHEFVEPGDQVRVVGEDDGFGCLGEDFKTVSKSGFIGQGLAGDELATAAGAYSPPTVIQWSAHQPEVCEQASRVPTERPGRQPQFDVRHGLPRYTSPDLVREGIADTERFPPFANHCMVVEAAAASVV